MSDFRRRRLRAALRRPVAGPFGRGRRRPVDRAAAGRLEVARVDDVVGQRDLRVAAALQRYRLLAEVRQHVVDRREPEVLDAALALVVYRHAQVLGATLDRTIIRGVNYGSVAENE